MPRGAIIGLCLALTLGLGTLSAPAAETRKTVRVEARTTTFGGSSYILGFGMCDLLNKYSPWLRGSVLESTGTPENIKMVGLSPAKRTRTFFTCAAEMFAAAKAGRPPFDQQADKFKDLMIMANQQEMAGVMITLDPALRTLADLKGKRVATWPRGTTKFDMTYKLIGGAGKAVLDSIKWQFTGYAGYNDMLLGKTDAAYAFLPEQALGRYTTVPKLKELMSKHRVYFVTATPAMRRLSGQLYGPVYGATAVIKKGSLGQDQPRQDVAGFNIVLAWAVYPQMPAEVVYEILKVTTTHGEQMKTYHSAGRGWVRDKWGAYPAPKKDWHPGARKFFEDQGIPYGQQHYDKLYPVN
ncbi:MAG: TAXI family TRAP transporter solute-binding subunit [Thermodesulfobacteriota bacterium]